MKNKLNGNGLKREIGLFSATILVIANMVGTGIFTTSGFIMDELRDPKALLLCWFFGGLFALCGALCYGELGARFPKAGGEYVFLRESFGRPMGFLSGWISLIVGFSAPIAAAAIAFSTYFFKTFGLDPGSGIPFVVGDFTVASFSFINAVAIFVVILFSLIHYHSLKIGARVQNSLTLLKAGIILLFIFIGFTFGSGSWGHFESQPLSQSFHAESFAVSLIFISFAFSGWNAAAYLGGEIKNPQRNIPLALIIGTIVVIIAYMALNILYIFALSPGEMGGVLEIGGVSAMALFGSQVGGYFNGAVALGLLSVLSAMIMAGPRVYYAMSKDNVFFKSFGEVDQKRKTPAASIFLQAGIAILMILTASYNTLLIYIGFTLSLFAMLTVIGLMWVRRTNNNNDILYKTVGYPVTPIFFILGNLWIIFYSIRSKPVAPLFGFGTIFVGILFYLYFSRQERSGKKHPIFKIYPSNFPLIKR